MRLAYKGRYSTILLFHTGGIASPCRDVVRHSSSSPEFSVPHSVSSCCDAAWSASTHCGPACSFWRRGRAATAWQGGRPKASPPPSFAPGHPHGVSCASLARSKPNINIGHGWPRGSWRSPRPRGSGRSPSPVGWWGPRRSRGLSSAPRGAAATRAARASRAVSRHPLHVWTRGVRTLAGQPLPRIEEALAHGWRSSHQPSPRWPRPGTPCCGARVGVRVVPHARWRFRTPDAAGDEPTRQSALPVVG